MPSYEQFVRNSGLNRQPVSEAGQVLGALSGLVDVFIRAKETNALQNFRNRQLTIEEDRLTSAESIFCSDGDKFLLSKDEG